MAIARKIARQTPSKKLWAFLNSAFGLWVLSTIAIGFFGWAYAQWEDTRRNTELVEKLDTEIKGRIDMTMDYSVSRAFLIDQKIKLADIFLYPPEADRTILPEFANRNLRSLLYELLQHVPARDVSDIYDALVQVRLIESEYMHKDLSSDEATDLINKVDRFQETRWAVAKEFGRIEASYYRVNIILGLFLLFPTFLLIYGFYEWVKEKIRTKKRLGRRKRLRAQTAAQ